VLPTLPTRSLQAATPGQLEDHAPDFGGPTRARTHFERERPRSNGEQNEWRIIKRWLFRLLVHFSRYATDPSRSTLRRSIANGGLVQ
jgi:hypothetical protein